MYIIFLPSIKKNKKFNIIFLKNITDIKIKIQNCQYGMKTYLKFTFYEKK